MVVKIISGNIDDKNLICGLMKNLSGKLLGDKGYLSKSLFQSLYIKGLRLITSIQSNIQNYFMSYLNIIDLQKCFKIETIFDILKSHIDSDDSCIVPLTLPSSIYSLPLRFLS